MMQVAAVQLHGFHTGEAEQGLLHALEMIGRAAGGNPDLMILPECTYPGYFLESRHAPGTSPDELGRAQSLFSQAARTHRCYIAVGLPERADGHLYNAGFVFAPDGSVAGKVRKSFLWHFDSLWFEPGDAYALCDTPFGRLGLLICSDARVPELCRILRMRGAQLLIDMTNWVASGREPAKLTNPQPEFLIPTRALENRFWVAAANKVGLERDAILYCGRSCLVDPSGNVRAMASADREEIITADLDLEETHNTTVAPGFDCISSRRPDLYGALSTPQPNRSDMVLTPPLYLACAQFDRLEEPGRIASGLRAALLIAPEMTGILTGTDGGAGSNKEQFLLACAGELGGAGHSKCRQAGLYSPNGTIGSYHKTHPATSEAGCIPGSDFPVLGTDFGKIGFILDEEGLIPEPARLTALAGADLIIWITKPWIPAMLPAARTRAAENACFVVLCGPETGSEQCGSAIVSPQGVVLAAAIPGRRQIISAQVVLSTARIKQIVPGTDAFAGRVCAGYTELGKGATRE